MKVTSSSPSISSLGIPYKSGKIYRPFSCVSKEQIKKYVKSWKQDWIEDPTNSDTYHTRNFFRHEVVKSIKTRQPKSLRHYVNWVNLLVNSLQQEEEKIKVSFSHSHSLVYWQKKPQLEFLKKKVAEEVKRISSANRGSIHKQLDKLEKMVDSKKEGPLLFSGGVLVFSYENQILVLKEEVLSRVQIKKEFFSGELKPSHLGLVFIKAKSGVSKSLKIQDYLTCQNSGKLITFMQWIKRRTLRSSELGESERVEVLSL